MSNMNRVLELDSERGLLEVQAGCLWSDLIPELRAMQDGHSKQWAVAQKQTGCDRLSIGGALAANVHGRGLTMPPLVADIESFKIVDSEGNSRTCSRFENLELFRT